jgi:hypothetical protein
LRLQRQSEEIHRHQRDKAQAKLAGDTGRDARARAIIEAAIEKARKRLQESAQ